MKKFLLSLCIFLYGAIPLMAQVAPPTTLSSTELKVWLRENWYDGKRIVLDYSTARGKMYNYVDNYNNKLTCVYSGYEESKAYSETNTSTNTANINCEHTVPQSWFNEAVRMRSDIHHLFPTVVQWNSDRGSDPFAEIPDNQTTKWIRGTSSQNSIPTSNIDEYSEDTNTQFEPREDHKGNLARSVFYFYTMHAGQSFDAGKGVISAVADVNTLYQWHLQDPVDDRERERNRRIEVAQGNRNPYIDYPELVAKAWGFSTANCSPDTQISNLTASVKGTTSFTLTWANGSGDRRLIVMREGAAASFTPAGNYGNANSNFSQATALENNYKVVYNGSGSTVNLTGLSANTAYHVQAFEYCAASNTYNVTAVPALAVTTQDYTCSGTPSNSTALTSGNSTASGFTLHWTNGSGDGRMVVVKKTDAITFVPANGAAYTGANANYTAAASLADGSKLVYNGDGNSVTVSGLESGAMYQVQVFESCTNGSQYATVNAPVLTVTTTAVDNGGNGSLIALQNFNATANDGWVVTSGFSSSADNTGTPAGQRVRTGASLQTNNTTKTLEFAEVNITGKSGVYVELYNSSVSVTEGNGLDAGDFLEVFVGLNGSSFTATPDVRITADANDSNVRYGMDGTAVLATTVGQPIVKTFAKANGETGTLQPQNAPSVIRVMVPDGSTSIKLKVVVKNNATNEIWNLDDVALYGEAATIDCDENALEGHAGDDKEACMGSSVPLGETAVSGYTYTWAPATGLSNSTIADPTFTPTTSGVYTFTVTATMGTCTYTDEVKVTVTEQIANNVISDDQNICAGATAQLINGNAPTGGTGFYTYEWQISTTGESGSFTPAPGVKNGKDYTPANLDQTTWFKRVIISGSCSSESNAVKISINAVPSAPVISQEGNTLTASVAGDSFEWLKNYQVLAGKTNQTIEITEAGSYKVRVKNTANCFSAYSEKFQVTHPLGLENEAGKVGFRLYPNPATGKFAIQVNEPMENVQLKLINALGKVMLQKQVAILKAATLEVGDLPSGIYYLHLYNKNTHVMQKVMLMQ